MRLQRQVHTCWIIGSVLNTRQEFNDVDIVLILNDWNIRRWLTRKKITFQLTFGKRLDVHIFHQTQLKEIHQFVLQADQLYKV
jgi:hypothetical protein